MGAYGGFYKGEKRKLKKEILEKKAAKIQRINVSAKIEIIGKKGK